MRASMVATWNKVPVACASLAIMICYGSMCLSIYTFPIPAPQFASPQVRFASSLMARGAYPCYGLEPQRGIVLDESGKLLGEYACDARDDAVTFWEGLRAPVRQSIRPRIPSLTLRAASADNRPMIHDL